MKMIIYLLSCRYTIAPHVTGIEFDTRLIARALYIYIYIYIKVFNSFQGSPPGLAKMMK